MSIEYLRSPRKLPACAVEVHTYLLVSIVRCGGQFSALLDSSLRTGWPVAHCSS